MLLSVATANFYFIPFEETLDIIAEAGFQNIELDLYWSFGLWTMAQHLQDLPLENAIREVHQHGLKVSSIHDGGGVLPGPEAISAYINPSLNEALDHLGYAPLYLVFHPPQVYGNPGVDWWQPISADIARKLEPYRESCKTLTLENMPRFDDLSVPLITPKALREFTRQHGLGITIDTTHYAQIDVDILAAARLLDGGVRSIHLSDFLPDRTHVFPGEGVLDLEKFLNLIDFSLLDGITLECSVTTHGRPDKEMDHTEMVSRMRALKTKVECMLERK